MADLSVAQAALEVAITDSNSTATAAVKAASTAAAATDPALVVAVSPNNNVPVQGMYTSGATMSGTIKPVLVGGSQSGAMQPIAVDVNGYVRTLNYPAYEQDALQFGTTINANGSSDESGVGSRELQVNIDLRTAPTGTNPTVQFFAQDVDPSDQTTLVTGTQTVGPIFSAAGLASFTHYCRSNIVRVSWIVGGTTPVFTNCYVYVTQKLGGSPPMEDRAVTTTALGALNAAISVPLYGYEGAAFQLAAGTLIGTIIPELSFDNGATWWATFFDDSTTGNKASSIVYGSANTLTARTIVGAGGASHARVRVSAFTSGTANAIARASHVNDPSLLYAGPSASAIQPPMIAQVGGWDGSALHAAGSAAKGTQSPFALATQDLKDSGRSVLTLAYTNATSTTAVVSTALATLVQNSNYTSTTGVTTFQVPSGKTLRLQSLSVTAMNAATTTVATFQSVVVSVRVSTTTVLATVTAAPIAAQVVVPISSNALNIGNSISINIPDGIEVPALQYVAITFQLAVASPACTINGVSLNGFTY